MTDLTETLELRELIKGSFETFDAYISERGIDLFLEDLKYSHEQMIWFALIEYMSLAESEEGPPDPRDIEAIIIKWCADNQVKNINQLTLQ